jgi:hypothetical protein
MAHQMWSAVDRYIADCLIPEDPALDADGRLITLEADARCAALARENIANAGLAQIVHVRVGDALQTLPELVDEGAGPFDVIFIDARFYELLAGEPRVSATVIQTVGAKGHDGFALALVTDEP